MKQYFIDKLKSNNEAIKRMEKSILEAASAMNLKVLMEAPEKLLKLKEYHKDLTNDCCRYCTVADVIEVSNVKDKYSGEALNLFDKKDIEYFYKYSTLGIHISDRDALVTRFGYTLKESKIR